ncbi:MAG: HAD-IB family hydrolase [Candidatus Chloroheliales bacterium]|nr:MAG: HAD-IB family hydrolase [Chloroflexota bacterium]
MSVDNASPLPPGGAGGGSAPRDALPHPASPFGGGGASGGGANTVAGRVAAIFDVDGTLIPGTSAERIFLRALLRGGLLGPRRAFAVTRALAGRLSAFDPLKAMTRDRIYLSGLDAQRMREFGRDLFSRKIMPRLSTIGLAALREHQREGHYIVLLSGSLDFLLQPLLEYTKADLLVASSLQVDAKGRFTGHIANTHPVGRHKASLLQELVEQHKIDLTASYAYADTAGDIHLLELVGHPVAINPRAALRKHAIEHGWEIKEFPLARP